MGGLAAQVKTVSNACPEDELVGWTSDFSKAYKQVPCDPQQVRYVVIVTFCPIVNKPVYFLSYCQVFGSRRFPPP